MSNRGGVVHRHCTSELTLIVGLKFQNSPEIVIDWKTLIMIVARIGPSSLVMPSVVTCATAIANLIRDSPRRFLQGYGAYVQLLYLVDGADQQRAVVSKRKTEKKM